MATGTPKDLVSSQLSGVDVPPSLGKIQESFRGPGDKSVILIQDAHGIPQAQIRIQELIDYLQKNYAIDFVGVEGASSPLDPQMFQSFPDGKLLHEILQKYMDQGELTGTTAAALLGHSPTRYMGLENWNRYEEGVSLYRDAIMREQEVTEFIKTMDAELRTSKNKFYSKELLEVDNAFENYRHDSRKFMTALLKMAMHQKPVKGSRLALLLEEYGKEKKDSEPFEIELKNKAYEIRKRLRQKEDLLLFNRKFQAFQTSEISSEDFALFLMGYAKDIAMSRALEHSVRRWQRLHLMEGDRLLLEFETYAGEVKEGLFRSENDRLVNQENEKAHLFKKLAKLELAHGEWERVKRRHDIPEVLSKHLEFYRNAEGRDQILFRNLMQRMKSQGILVAGGFHTEGLKKRLRQSGVSYHVIHPRFQWMPTDSFYRQQMQGNLSWRRYFVIKNGKVDLYGAFVRAIRDELLEKGDATLAKRWRDRIILDLAKQKRIIEVKEYTHFIDEILKKGMDGGRRPQWMDQLDRFVRTLGKLKAQDWADEESLHNLVEPATTPTYVNASAARGDYASVRNLTPLRIERSPNRVLSKPLPRRMIQARKNSRPEVRSRARIGKVVLAGGMVMGLAATLSMDRSSQKPYEREITSKFIEGGKKPKAPKIDEKKQRETRDRLSFDSVRQDVPPISDVEPLHLKNKKQKVANFEGPPDETGHGQGKSKPDSSLTKKEKIQLDFDRFPMLEKPMEKWSREDIAKAAETLETVYLKGTIKISPQVLVNFLSPKTDIRLLELALKIAQKRNYDHHFTHKQLMPLIEIPEVRTLAVDVLLRRSTSHMKSLRLLNAHLEGQEDAVILEILKGITENKSPVDYDFLDPWLHRYQKDNLITVVDQSGVKVLFQPDPKADPKQRWVSNRITKEAIEILKTQQKITVPDGFVKNHIGLPSQRLLELAQKFNRDVKNHKVKLDLKAGILGFDPEISRLFLHLLEARPDIEAKLEWSDLKHFFEFTLDPDSFFVDYADDLLRIADARGLPVTEEFVFERLFPVTTRYTSIRLVGSRRMPIPLSWLGKTIEPPAGKKTIWDLNIVEIASLSKQVLKNLEARASEGKYVAVPLAEKGAIWETIFATVLKEKLKDEFRRQKKEVPAELDDIQLGLLHVLQRYTDYLKTLTDTEQMARTQRVAEHFVKRRQDPEFLKEVFVGPDMDVIIVSGGDPQRGIVQEEGEFYWKNEVNVMFQVGVLKRFLKHFTKDPDSFEKRIQTFEVLDPTAGKKGLDYDERVKEFKAYLASTKSNYLKAVTNAARDGKKTLIWHMIHGHPKGILQLYPPDVATITAEEWARALVEGQKGRDEMDFGHIRIVGEVCFFSNYVTYSEEKINEAIQREGKGKTVKAFPVFVSVSGLNEAGLFRGKEVEGAKLWQSTLRWVIKDMELKRGEPLTFGEMLRAARELRLDRNVASRRAAFFVSEDPGVIEDLLGIPKDKRPARRGSLLIELSQRIPGPSTQASIRSEVRSFSKRFALLGSVLTFAAALSLPGGEQRNGSDMIKKVGADKKQKHLKVEERRKIGNDKSYQGPPDKESEMRHSIKKRIAHEKKIKPIPPLGQKGDGRTETQPVKPAPSKTSVSPAPKDGKPKSLEILKEKQMAPEEKVPSGYPRYLGLVSSMIEEGKIDPKMGERIFTQRAMGVSEKMVKRVFNQKGKVIALSTLNEIEALAKGYQLMATRYKNQNTTELPWTLALWSDHIPKVNSLMKRLEEGRINRETALVQFGKIHGDFLSDFEKRVSANPSLRQPKGENAAAMDTMLGLSVTFMQQSFKSQYETLETQIKTKRIPLHEAMARWRKVETELFSPILTDSLKRVQGVMNYQFKNIDEEKSYGDQFLSDWGILEVRSRVIPLIADSVMGHYLKGQTFQGVSKDDKWFIVANVLDIPHDGEENMHVISLDGVYKYYFIPHMEHIQRSKQRLDGNQQLNRLLEQSRHLAQLLGKDFVIKTDEKTRNRIAQLIREIRDERPEVVAKMVDEIAPALRGPTNPEKSVVRVISNGKNGPLGLHPLVSKQPRPYLEVLEDFVVNDRAGRDTDMDRDLIYDLLSMRVQSIAPVFERMGYEKIPPEAWKEVRLIAKGFLENAKPSYDVDFQTSTHGIRARSTAESSDHELAWRVKFWDYQVWSRYILPLAHVAEEMRLDLVTPLEGKKEVERIIRDMSSEFAGRRLSPRDRLGYADTASIFRKIHAFAIQESQRSRIESLKDNIINDKISLKEAVRRYRLIPQTSQEGKANLIAQTKLTLQEKILKRYINPEKFTYPLTEQVQTDLVNAMLTPSPFSREEQNRLTGFSGDLQKGNLILAMDEFIEKHFIGELQLLSQRIDSGTVNSLKAKEELLRLKTTYEELGKALVDSGDFHIVFQRGNVLLRWDQYYRRVEAQIHESDKEQEKPPRSELRKVSREVLRVFRGDQSHLNPDSLLKIRQARRHLLPALYTEAQRLRSEEDRMAGSNAMRYWDSILKINTPVIVEYHVSSEKTIEELLKAVRDSVSINRNLIARIVAPENLKKVVIEIYDSIDHHKNDSVQKLPLEGQLILHHAGISPKVDLKGLATVVVGESVAFRVGDKILDSDVLLQNNEIIPYDGPDGSMMAAKLYMGALILGAVALREQPVDEIVPVAPNHYRFRNLDSLNAISLLMINLLEEQLTKNRISGSA